jgi:hypothetical protein
MTSVTFLMTPDEISEYAAPDGAYYLLCIGATKMPLLRSFGFAGAAKRKQRPRASGQ